jgi:lipoprotein-releasing system permease protein
MIKEFKIASRYFFSPRENTPKIIPRAGTVALALSMVVLLATLSVMNGFDRNIKESILSRMPHIFSTTFDLDKLSEENWPQITDSGAFYQTRVFVPNWHYQQVYVFISERFEQPMISSSLVKQHFIQTPSSIDLVGFKEKKLFKKPVAHSLKIPVESVKKDSTAALYLPLSYLEQFDSLPLVHLTGIWIEDPFKAQQVQERLQSFYPKENFYTWISQHEALFKALLAEKRLVGVVLSLLLLLIFVQISLTMILIFKDKQKDMVTLFCFFNKEKSVFKVFFFYAFINILLGIFLGSCLGVALSYYLPDIVHFFEVTLHIDVLPYDEYGFDKLPSYFIFSDLIAVASFSLFSGLLCSYFLIKKLAKQPVISILRQYQ